MKTSNKYGVALLPLVSLLVLLGCGPGNPFGLVPVSGTVTIDGQPAPDIVIVFTPVPNEDTSIVGPFSSAVTDAEGKFTLKSKQGKPGAVPGSHSVSLQYRSFNPEAVDDLKQRLQSAQQSGKNVATLKTELAKALKEPMLPERYSGIRLTVEKSGLKDHKFELTLE